MVLRLQDGRRYDRRMLWQMAQGVLLLTQAELGEKLGVSKRTVLRWSNRQTDPAGFHVERLAALLRAEGDDELADSLLEEAGLPIPEPVAVPAPSPALARSLVDAVVFAAADAADLSPRATRLALRAALLRATELGVPLDALADALAPTPPPASTPP